MAAPPYIFPVSSKFSLPAETKFQVLREGDLPLFLVDRLLAGTQLLRVGVYTLCSRQALMVRL